MIGCFRRKEYNTNSAAHFNSLSKSFFSITALARAPGPRAPHATHALAALEAGHALAALPGLPGRQARDRDGEGERSAPPQESLPR